MKFTEGTDHPGGFMTTEVQGVDSKLLHVADNGEILPVLEDEQVYGVARRLLKYHTEVKTLKKLKAQVGQYFYCNQDSLSLLEEQPGAENPEAAPPGAANLNAAPPPESNENAHPYQQQYQQPMANYNYGASNNAIMPPDVRRTHAPVWQQNLHPPAYPHPQSHGQYQQMANMPPPPPGVRRTHAPVLQQNLHPPTHPHPQSHEQYQQQTANYYGAPNDTMMQPPPPGVPPRDLPNDHHHQQQQALGTPMRRRMLDRQQSSANLHNLTNTPQFEQQDGNGTPMRRSHFPGTPGTPGTPMPVESPAGGFWTQQQAPSPAVDFAAIVQSLPQEDQLGFAERVLDSDNDNKRRAATIAGRVAMAQQVSQNTQSANQTIQSLGNFPNL